MLRIRFHGRGGQGAKTAARIVGTAAFLEGYTAQDSPLYGAERRGAPVTASARLAKGPILERGQIARPDLVVVADDTLLDHPAARVLAGVGPHTVVFVNTPRAAADLRLDAVPASRIVTRDLTDLALSRLGKGAALSAPLGAVAGRLAGLGDTPVRRAVERELRDLHLSEAVIAKNVALAEDCYRAVPAPSQPTGDERKDAEPAAGALHVPAYADPARGTAQISVPANAPLRKTGDWRTFRPVLDPEKCNGCWLCFVYCPDAAIAMDEGDKPRFDYDHCKGCLLCVEECPTHALLVERETPPAAKG